MSAVFFGMQSWPINEEIVDVLADDRILRLYHEWDLQGIVIRPSAIELHFSSHYDPREKSVVLAFRDVSTVLLTVDPTRPSDRGEDDAVVDFRLGFSTLHHMIITGNAGDSSQFEIHFSDAILAFHARSVELCRGASAS